MFVLEWRSLYIFISGRIYYCNLDCEFCFNSLIIEVYAKNPPPPHEKKFNVTETSLLVKVYFTRQIADGVEVTSSIWS